MKTSPTARFSEGPVALTPKQANIYCWGWQKKARFRDAVCGRRFGKTFLGKAEIRRAARLAAEWGVSTEDEIWYCAPTFKQAKRVFWKRLKQAIPPSWRAGKPNETECSITTKAGHVIRIVGLDAYDNLRGSGLFFALVDEWADCVYAAWEEVLRPMLSTCRFVINGEERVGGHALRIGTPKGFNHCYDSYLDGQGREPDHKSWLSEPNGDFDTKEIEQVRVLGRGTWQTWRQSETGSKKEWALYEEGITSLKIIPFVPVYGKRLGYMQATPPLLELAHSNVEHWQSKSDQQNILHVARVPILFAKMLGEGGITVGAGSAVKSESPEGDLKFVEHGGKAIEAGRLSILDLEDRMRQAGAELLVIKPGNVTESQTLADNEQGACALQKIAGNVEDAGDQALQFMAEWVAVTMCAAWQPTSRRCA